MEIGSITTMNITPQEQEEFEFRLRLESEIGTQPAPTNNIQEDSQKYGSITKTPTLLEKFGSRLTSNKTRPLGITGGLGVLSSMAGFPEEDLLPSVGQVSGGLAGGFGGAVGGSAVGSTLQQFLKPLRGEKPNPVNAIKDIGITALVEGLTRGTGKFIFRRQIANEAKNALGKQLGAMKEALAQNTSITVPSESIYIPMKEAFEKVAVPHGKQASILNKWFRFMENNPTLSTRNLIELEDDLGKVAQFGEFQAGVLVNPEVKKAPLNNLAKEARASVSKIVDDLAEQSGQAGFGDISKKLSKYLDNPKQWDVTHPTGTFGQRIIGAGLAGTATGNPLDGGLAYLGIQGVQSPAIRNAAFSATKNNIAKFLGRSARVGTSETLRRVSK